MGRPEGEGEEEKEQRARVRSGLGRSRDLASDWEAASKPSTRRAGGQRARARWGRNPGPGKGYGATRRDVGCGSGRVLGRFLDKDTRERIGSRTPGSLGGGHLGPHAWILEDNEGDASQVPCRKLVLKGNRKPASGFTQGCGGRTTEFSHAGCDAGAEEGRAGGRSQGVEYGQAGCQKRDPP